MIYYLAGKMSGIPQFNFPAFIKAAAILRSRGHNIISPAELDSKEVREQALESTDGILHNGKIAGETWGDILSRDVKIVADDVQGIVFLPGWEYSRGARLEAFVGLLCKHSFNMYDPDHHVGMRRLRSEYIRDMLYDIDPR